LNGLLHSSALRLAGEVLVLLAVVLWLGLAFRVHRDARRRVGDGFLVALATLLALAVPFVGPLVYLLFRPPETLDESRVRRVELLALRDHVGRPEPVCPVCRTEIEDDFIVCPVCTSRLKHRCARCDAGLDPLWQACPYCAAPVEALPSFDLDAALTAEAQSPAPSIGVRRR
jgi:Double zinc ribbon